MSSISQLVTEKLKEAMREKNTQRLNTIRALRGEITMFEKKSGDKEIDEASFLAIVKQQIKQRRDAIEQFEKGGRADLAEQDKGQIEILQEFLPEQLSEEEVTQIIELAIGETAAVSMKDMGKVMGKVKPAIAATGKDADNSMIAQIVKSKLN
ncbi:MAG: GatB/YqeY domain-containing protein [Lentisphaeria bacterium]|nr:GatB/YqeY domain-containing protein [Lentisphaeria bacterium]